MDSRVVSTTHLVAKGASLPYRAAKMAAVDPAGIPVMMTDTPVATRSIPSSRQRPKATAGSRASRNTLKKALTGKGKFGRHELIAALRDLLDAE